MLTVNFVSTIKKNKLELKLKRKGKHNAYERHLLNSSVRALLVQAVEAAYRTKLHETEVEYQVNIYKKYGQLEDCEKT